MKISDLNIGWARQRVWLYGSIVLALIFGLALLVKGTPVSAHGVGMPDVSQGEMVQAYNSESDEHVIHAHSTSADRWDIYVSSSSQTNCKTRTTGWVEVDKSSRRNEIVL